MEDVLSQPCMLEVNQASPQCTEGWYGCSQGQPWRTERAFSLKHSTPQLPVQMNIPGATVLCPEECVWLSSSDYGRSCGPTRNLLYKVIMLQ